MNFYFYFIITNLRNSLYLKLYFNHIWGYVEKDIIIDI